MVRAIWDTYPAGPVSKLLLVRMALDYTQVYEKGMDGGIFSAASSLNLHKTAHAHDTNKKRDELLAWLCAVQHVVGAVTAEWCEAYWADVERREHETR